MKLHHPNPVIATPTGDWSAARHITATVLDALDTADDYGRVTGGTVATARRLLKLGLAEPRGLGVGLTASGWRILNTYTQYYVRRDHTVRYVSGREPIGAERVNPWTGGLVQDTAYTYRAYCRCSWSALAVHPDERRYAVAAHRRDHGIT